MRDITFDPDDPDIIFAALEEGIGTIDGISRTKGLVLKITDGGSTSTLSILGKTRSLSDPWRSLKIHWAQRLGLQNPSRIQASLSGGWIPSIVVHAERKMVGVQFVPEQLDEKWTQVIYRFVGSCP